MAFLTSSAMVHIAYGFGYGGLRGNFMYFHRAVFMFAGGFLWERYFYLKVS